MSSATRILTVAAVKASSCHNRTSTSIVSRQVATSTKASKKSALGVVVPATNMALSSSSLLFPMSQGTSQQQQHQQQHPASSNSSSSRSIRARDTQSLSSLAATVSDATTTSSSTRDAVRNMKSPVSSSLSSSTTTSSSLAHRKLLLDPDTVDMVELQKMAALTPTPLRLGDMYKYAASADLGQRLRNAQFLHRELPIRLAQRAYDLLSLPHGLSSESTPIRKVALTYVRYIQQFQAFPCPTNQREEDQFTEMLHSMVSDRTSIPTTIAQGLMEWLSDDRREDFELSRQQEMEDALVRFFTARVGLRFLTEHHILSSPTGEQQATTMMRGLRASQTQCPMSSSPAAKDRGCIQHDCDPVAECEKVAQEVTRQTLDCYGICPKIEIVDRPSDTAKPFTYVPHHLHYMLAELLKNSCRATVERYKGQGGTVSPTAKMTPVRVVIVKGAAEVTIKVSDEGGGIPRSTMSRIFKFTHSTSRQEYEGNTDFGTVEAGIKHMPGFGLPLARIYARYFGGELTLKSMEGYGLDAYLYLPRLGDACENLPRRVIASPGEQVSLPSVRATKAAAAAATRAFSTLAKTTKQTNQLGVPSVYLPSAVPADEPWVMDINEQFDQAAWEEDKVRRVMEILRSRALQ